MLAAGHPAGRGACPRNLLPLPAVGAPNSLLPAPALGPAPGHVGEEDDGFGPLRLHGASGASRSQPMHPSLSPCIPVPALPWPRVMVLVAYQGPLGTSRTWAGVGKGADPPGAAVGPCFWPSLGEGKRRSCWPGCLPPESCVSIGGCRGGELFTVTLGGGPGMKPQMNSSCSGRSGLKQTAPRAGRALRRGPELLEPRLEQEGCRASWGAATRRCHVPEGSQHGDGGRDSCPGAGLRSQRRCPQPVLVPCHPGTWHVKHHISKLWKTALSFVALARAGLVRSCNVGASCRLGRPCHPGALWAGPCSHGVLFSSHPPSLPPPKSVPKTFPAVQGAA